MRGKDPPIKKGGKHLRITPAHAGKSEFCISHSNSFWDHPRTCGEKYYKPFCPFIVYGSPPHMRGKVEDLCPRSFQIRITPAHAGKRQVLILVLTVLGDHPRTCGEKRWNRAHYDRIGGSPPHMRGKVIMLSHS